MAMKELENQISELQRILKTLRYIKSEIVNNRREVEKLYIKICDDESSCTEAITHITSNILKTRVKISNER